MRRSGRGRVRGCLGLVALCGAFLIVILGLGVLRFHAARLAYHLDSLNLSIQRYAKEETALQQQLSTLVSPYKVYSYCKERLGMTKALTAETLTVRSSRGLAAKKETEVEKQGWRATLAWLLGE